MARRGFCEFDYKKCWLELEDDDHTIYGSGKQAEYLSCTTIIDKDDDGDDTRCLETLYIRDKSALIGHSNWYYGKGLVRLAY